MIVVIRIENLNGRTEIGLNDKNNMCIVNGTKKNVDVSKFIKEIIGLTLSWTPVMKKDNVIDAESYTVLITNGKTEKTYVGKNAFPLNYNEFKKLISEIIYG